MFKKGNQVNKGRIPWNKGGSHTLEVRKKMSEVRKVKGTSPAQMEVLNRMSEANKGRKLSEDQKEALRKANTGKTLSQETRNKISSSLKGKPNWAKGKPKSEETKEKIRQSLTGRLSPNKGKKRPNISGENHWNWKDGITTENETFRKSMEYKLWRKAVFERDGYACTVGGKEHGNKLNADHIKPFAWFPELRLAIDNGQTLCESCHRKTPTYAGRANKLYAT